jgi:hypothetical protein
MIQCLINEEAFRDHKQTGKVQYSITSCTNSFMSRKIIPNRKQPSLPLRSIVLSLPLLSVLTETTFASEKPLGRYSQRQDNQNYYPGIGILKTTYERLTIEKSSF